MTGYKKWLKTKGFKFDEDYDFLPNNMGLETSAVYCTRFGFMVVKVYTSIVDRKFICPTYNKKFSFVDVYDEDDEVEPEKIKDSVKISKYHDDSYYYMFNDDDELIAVLTPRNKLAEFFRQSDV